jgi:hypothetical protein
MLVGQFFFPLIAIALGFVALRRGDRLTKWIAALALTTCVLILIDFVPRMIRGVKVGAVSRDAVEISAAGRFALSPNGVRHL